MKNINKKGVQNEHLSRKENREECNFTKAWNALLAGNDVVITSMVSKDKYMIDKSNLKFFSIALNSWRKCNFISSEELLGTWSISGR